MSSLREKLAMVGHKQRALQFLHLCSRSYIMKTRDQDSEFLVVSHPEYVRLKSMMYSTYDELTEEDKEKARQWADRATAVFAEHMAEAGMSMAKDESVESSG